jgi:HPt (histidine-containing phosphotransfer) domain-containing protein
MDMTQDKEIFNREELLDRLSGDEETITIIVSVFIEDVSSQAEELRNAIESEQLKKIEQIAHRIKGSSANISAGAINKICFQIESLAKNNDLSTIKSIFPEFIEQIQKFKEHCRV